MTDFHLKMQNVAIILGADFRDVHERSAELKFSDGSGYLANQDWRGKCEISCLWPRDEENKPMIENSWFHIPYGQKAKHRIGLNWNKDAEKIAQDILRRLSRSYKLAYAEALAKRVTRLKYSNDKTLISDKLEELTYGLGWGVHFANDDKLIKLELNGLSLETAEKIIEIYKEGLTDDI